VSLPNLTPPLPASAAARPKLEPDASGRFQLCPIPDFQMFLLMMAHRYFRWNVCTSQGGTWTLVQRSSRYTLADAGPREIERIECDLSGGEVRCSRTTDIDITREKLGAVLGQKRCEGVRSD
jgi:hypothetical protein